MVTTACFPPSARRYPALRTPYLASYVERGKATDHRETICTAVMGDGADDNASQRKRIAVAVRKPFVCVLPLGLLRAVPPPFFPVAGG
ncbi:hypothetical protein OCS_04080 [Ophiocordyceps sinensis CO18]|uniref:Uncharacterized protein n=1 Tax=Ophiocordyceps sinensis (strain Co18 / CGMCC 3.14243) TaxID=911162 RepID=T5ACT4_OPHSC|nr:hypothetical protein OCS_04080 [Ophiocordyceps sinensis CO18]